MNRRPITNRSPSTDPGRPATHPWRGAWRAALLLALCGLVGPAWAHKASDAYLHWTLQDGQVLQRVDVSLLDLERELALDADADGRLSWGEVRRQWPAIQQLVAQGVRLSAGGRDCRVLDSAATPQLDSHSDGRYAVLQQRFDCGNAAALQVDYQLFQRSDPTHRGIARVELGALTQRVLVPGAGPVPLSADADARAPTSAWSAWAGFVAEGMHHVAIGLDHVLFLLTLLMVAVWRRDGAGWTPRQHAASAWRETLKLVTAFTLSHSLTLALATLGVLAPPSRWVESLIALSVLLAAADNLRPFLPGPRWATVAVFGLVHGFGFAGAMQPLALPGSSLALSLFGFNLGVELGQLALVALCLPAAVALRHSAVYRVGVVRGGSCMVAALASLWLLERGLALDFGLGL